MVTVVVAAALGLVMGAVIGGLGGGGGVLTVPALVYVLGQSAQDATTGSVIIVGVTAAAGVLVHWPGGVERRTGFAFAAAGVPAAWLGTLLNRHVGQPVLLLAFAGLTIVAGAVMLVSFRNGGTAVDPVEEDDVGAADGAATAVRAPSAIRRRVVTAAKVVVGGAAVGFLYRLPRRRRWFSRRCPLWSSCSACR